MQERKENSPRRLLIEAPERLELGKNFYDHPPFNEVISRAVREHPSANQSLQHRAVTHIAREVGRTRDSQRQASLLALYEDPNRRAKLFLGSKRYGFREDAVALGQILGTFQLFPLWTDYVNSQLIRSSYNEDGGYRAARTNVALVHPPSYPAWLEEEAQRMGRISKFAVQVVLAETFPQQLEGKSVNEVVSRGRRSTNRSWAIMTEIR